MTENEIKVLKMNLLGGMDQYIRNCISDEEVHESWLALGVPDGATENDLAELADDLEDFSAIVNLFGNLVWEERDPFEDAIS